MNHESARALGWELANARDQISEGLRERLEFGLSRSEAAVAEAHAVFEQRPARVSRLHGGAGRAGDAVRARPGAGRTGMDRRSGVQPDLDQLCTCPA